MPALGGVRSRRLARTGIREGTGLDLNDYLRALRQHWFGAVVLVSLAGATAFLLSSIQTPVYAANSSGIVSMGLASDPRSRRCQRFAGALTCDHLCRPGDKPEYG
jgi:hypothetical protein